VETHILTKERVMGRRYPQEVRERAVRLVQEHREEYPSEWAALSSIAGKFGMVPETLREWVRREQIDAGQRGGLTTEERQQLKELQRENRELKRANEILKSASAFFARELDPQPRKQ
jgi:transposase-like protein